jgi:hypothetical protein
MVELIAMFALVAALIWLAQRHGLHNTSPLHLAFTLTAAGLLLLATGILGFSIRKSGGLPYLQPLMP